MTRYNVEMKYQVTVEANDEQHAYKVASEMVRPEDLFASHCRKVKNGKNI